MRVTESQNESVNESVNERTPERKIVNLEIVDFLDLDISKITFTKPKPNKHNGTQIGILYNGKTLFVKYDGYTPFGLNEKYDKNGEYQGTSMQINCDGEYLEKAKELDQFFIDYLHSLKVKKAPREAVAGYDEYGQDGSWKRICKKPYKMVDNERKYLDYPSKMEFSLFYRNDRLDTKFFTWDRKKIEYESVKIGPRSRVKFIASWFSLTTGTFGATLKPKLMQLAFREEEDLFNNFILDENEILPIIEEDL